MGACNLIGVVIVYYAPEIRAYLGDIVRSRTTKSFASDEVAKEQLINTLVTTVDYLSKRSIGALITIEKEHSLNTYIEKAIRLESAISFELLSTIFLPGTPLHDGAVIIRGTTLMCAGAFLPSSDKADIPKNLGSRHRAAIGISEVSDAFTIVVSEETAISRLRLTEPSPRRFRSTTCVFRSYAKHHRKIRRRSPMLIDHLKAIIRL